MFPWSAKPTPAQTRAKAKAQAEADDLAENLQAKCAVGTRLDASFESNLEANFDLDQDFSFPVFEKVARGDNNDEGADDSGDENARPSSHAPSEKEQRPAQKPVTRRAARAKTGVLSDRTNMAPEPFRGAAKPSGRERNEVREAAGHSRPKAGVAASPARSERSFASFASDGEEAESALLSETPPARSDEGAKSAEPEHPFYGRLLHDYGTKRLYNAWARALIANVPIWHTQRPCNEDRVEAIVKAKRGNPVFLGNLSIYDIVDRSKRTLRVKQERAIIDGQHRAEAIERLLNEMPADQDIAISIEVYPVASEKEGADLFREINLSEPVQNIDLPHHLQADRNALITIACQRLKKQFSEMFKESVRCRAPHVNVDILRNSLFECTALLESEHIKTAEGLLAAMLRCNEILRAREREDWPESVHRNLKRANEHGFYLGLCKDWIDTLLVPAAAAGGNVAETP